MKLVTLTYEKIGKLLQDFKPQPLIDDSKIDNQGIYLIVDSLDDFRGFVAKARVSIYIAYKTLKGPKAGSADARLDKLLSQLLNHNVEIAKVGLVRIKNSTMIYRIEITMDICAEVMA